MEYLEKALHDHFATVQHAQGNVAATAHTNGVSTADQRSTTRTRRSPPFAKVNSVVSGSPADRAGLRAGDAVCGFGDINWMNHERLSKIAEMVQRSEMVFTCHAWLFFFFFFFP